MSELNELHWRTTTQIARQVRAETIEECAQLLEKMGARYTGGHDLIEAIRALKTKPAD